MLYPPVDTDFFTPSATTSHRGFALVVSALVPYKRVDIAIEAAARAGVPLTIVGTGPDEAALRRLASGHDVTFAGSVSAEALRDLYRSALTLMLPGEEDFGIAPVEALACGCPVIALARGGATETVTDGVTGRLVADLSPDAFAAALTDLAATRPDAATCRSHALRFAPAAFDAGFRQLVGEMLAPC